MTSPWNTDAPIGPYLRRARAAGIDKTIVMATFHSDYAKANAQVARIIAQHPARLIGFAFVHAKRDAGRIHQMVHHAVTRWSFRGIKIHGHEAMPTREVCEVARALRLPLLVDVTSRPEVVDMLAPQFPQVNFIIAHLGSNTDDFRAHQMVIDQLVRYPNVYAETSAVRQYDYIVRAVRRAGPRKLLFGSDGPWLHPGVEIQKVRLLGLPPRAEALVLGDNLRHLLSQTQLRTAPPSAGRQTHIVSPAPSM